MRVPVNATAARGVVLDRRYTAAASYISSSQNNGRGGERVEFLAFYGLLENVVVFFSLLLF